MKFYLFLQLQPQDEFVLVFMQEFILVLEHELLAVLEHEFVFELFSKNITSNAVKKANIVYIN